MIRYSFIVPIYNDADLAEDFCIEFQKTFIEYLKTNDVASKVELIFVNDGSPKQESFSILKQTATKFPFVKVINLSRNFGQHIALSCGYQHASGQYVGMLNVDMQDPPDQIPKVLQVIENDSDIDIIYGLRDLRKDKWFRTFFSRLHNKTLNYLTNTKTPINVATLRIMNRKFVDAYNSLIEKSRYIPGLENWLGFRHHYVQIHHQERKKGKSSYTFMKLLKLGLDSVLSFSDFPLRVVSVVGIIISFIGFIMMLLLIIQKLFLVDFMHGYTSIMSTILLVGGIQIFVIGLAGLYIGRILKEVQGRPLYIVKDLLNFD